MATCIYIKDPFTRARIAVDFEDEASFEIEYAVSDLRSRNSPRSFVSRSVTLLGTKMTNRALQLLYRSDSENRIRTARDLNRISPQFLDTVDILEGNQYFCEVIKDGVDLLKGSGILTIEDVNINIQREEVRYEASIVGTRYNWILQLDGINLSDVQIPTHTYDELVPINSLDRRGKLGTTFDHNYIGATYVPVHYGRWGPDNMAATDYVRQQDLRPAVYIKSIIDSFFRDHTDYTLVSQFFDSDVFTGLITPYTEGGINDPWYAPDGSIATNAIFLHTTEEPTGFPNTVQSYNFNFGISNNLRLFRRQGLNSQWNFTSNTYSPVSGGDFDFTIDIIFQANDASGTQIDIGVYDLNTGTYAPNGGPVILHDGTNAGAQNVNIAFNTVCLNANGNYAILMTQQATVNPITNFQVFASDGSSGLIGLIDQDLVQVTQITAGGVCLNGEIDLAGILRPSVSAKDLLDELTGMFNLVWNTDPIDKIIYVEPDSSIVNCEIFQDWTRFLDCTRDVNITYTKSDVENLEFKYKEDDEDFFVKDLKNTVGDGPYLSRKLQLNTSDPEFKDQENKLFAASYYIFDGMVQGTSQNTPVWIRMWNEDPVINAFLNQNSHAFEMRIAYYYGLVDENEVGYENPFFTGGAGSLYGYNYRSETAATTTFYPYFPYAFMVDRYRSSDPISLAYEDNTVAGSEGLVTKYWGSYASVQRVGKMLTAFFKFPVDELNNIDLFRAVYIDNPVFGSGLYRINRIAGYNPTSELAKVELAKL